MTPSSVQHDLEYLSKRGVKHLVHFTPAINVTSILQYGIRPRAYLEQHQIDFKFTDEMRLDDKLDAISLSISVANVKMLNYKRRESKEASFIMPEDAFCVLLVNPCILNEVDGYDLYPINAASANAKSCTIEELFASENRTAIPEEWPTDIQAEILIKGVINPKHIESIVFNPSDIFGNNPIHELANNLKQQVKRLKLDCKIQADKENFAYTEDKLLEWYKNTKTYPIWD